MERNVIPRIKLLRTQQGYSLQGLAEVTGLTKSYLSKLERGVCTPSIAAALRIARALGVDTQALFGETATNPDIAVIRHHARMSVERPAGLQGGRRLEILPTPAGLTRMQPFVLHLASDFAAGPQVAGHAGEEFLYVLEGDVEMEWGERRERLMPGDAVYFNASVPHRLRALGKSPAAVLVVTSAAASANPLFTEDGPRAGRPTPSPR
ncbi:Transcriptional regulator, contains XRE-family HTH domain [Gulbenkiania indica]|uniref:Transcriptional regulator, contains XRE-family HTH domain n=1 Tax=Gulbenkiania indica TaxID=375574 RepID=A0A0K6GRP1_9NEIS|nr:Transcriptional regulator, contains XRE-family HTH domain [Gulbenkiania indica]